MLWVDKYRPLSLDKLTYHDQLSECLKRIAGEGELPHLLFYGPPGAGKKTRVMALLKAVFGPSVQKLKLEHKTMKTPTNRAIEVQTISSNHHIEINPSDVGLSDRFVVQEVIKEIAQYHPLDTTSAKNFKVVLLVEVDHLSKEAQHALRRTMEKYSRTCRLILICNSLSKVIDPVRSRCLCLRIAAPTHDEIVSVLQTTCKKESLQIPTAFAQKIAMASGRNLRKALLMLESAKVKQYPFNINSPITLTDWEAYIELLAHDITKEQSPQCLLTSRSKLYELLGNCIPPEIIIQRLTKELMKKLDNELKHEVAYWASYYEYRLRCGSKEIYHLEAFVARFMTIYKKYLIELFG